MRVLRIILKQNPFLNILTILVTIIFFTLIFAFVINVNQANIEMKTANNFEGQNVFQLTDQLIEGKEESFFKGNRGYDVLNKFNNTLSESQKFTYYTATWQPVGVADFKGDKSFDPNYQNGGSPSPVHEYNNKMYSYVFAMQVNKDAFEFNNLQIVKGREFKDTEYTFKGNSSTIPVILGDNFSGLYKIGSKIDIFLYGKVLKGKVIGFLEASQKIMTANQPEVILDRYIVLPALTFNNEPSEYLQKDRKNELFIRATLLANTNSLILTKQTPLEIRKTMDQIAMKTGFYDFQIIGANSLAVNALVHMTKANITLIVISIILLFIITLSIFIYILSLKVKKNIDTYLVLLISGANMEHIKKFVLNELLLLTLIGVIVPIVPLLLLSGGSFSTLGFYIFVSLLFVLLISQFVKRYVNKIFAKIDIVQFLKR